MEDTLLGKMLLERGLLTPEEYEEAEAARRESGRPLVGILVEKKYLSPEQVQDALAALQKRVRFCPRCNEQVPVRKMMGGRERCPRCLSEVQWREESSFARIKDLENLVQLTQDELPAEVQLARRDPDRLFGKYVLVKELGRGGSGLVEKAWDTMLGEFVALKFLHPPRRNAPKSQVRRPQGGRVAALLKEARASLRLRHDHVVAVRDVGCIDDQYFIAMDYIDGAPLSDHVKESRMGDSLSPLYEKPAVYLRHLRDIAQAIHFAHSLPEPIVHCDLKPGNVLISRDGKAFVMDFGLARVMGPRRGPEEDRIKGTPAYMAPEQAQGRSSKIDHRTDVYGLGAILYELLSGRPVFPGEPIAAMKQAMQGAPERPVEVAKKLRKHWTAELTTIRGKISKLEEICLKCLAKEPEDRYPAARQVAEELAAVLEAIEAGREVGILPPRLQEAQERSELQGVDHRLNRLDVGRAREEVERLKGRRSGSAIRRRLADRRHQVFLLEQFLARLVARLNAERPTLDRFPLEGESLEAVEILKATPQKLVIFHAEASREIPWTSVPPAQVVRLAETLKQVDPADRLALGILCRHSGLLEESARFMASLQGTLLADVARDIMDEAD